MTTFTNEKRVCGRTIEGFGEYATTWNDYEIKCSCGKWTRNYGEVSEQVGKDPNMQAWLCEACVERIDIEERAFESWKEQRDIEGSEHTPIENIGTTNEF